MTAPAMLPTNGVLQSGRGNAQLCDPTGHEWPTRGQATASWRPRKGERRAQHHRERKPGDAPLEG
jgi:hypothetical protein